MKLFVDPQGNWQRYQPWQDEVVATEPDMFKFVDVDAEPYPGTLYKDGKFVIPLPDLGALKQLKLNEVQRWTAAAITGGFLSAGVRYDSDMDTQVTMQGICLSVDTHRFAEEYPQGCPVRGYDEGSEEKTIHMLDAAGVKLFCADLAAHIGDCKKKGWQLQQAVSAAKTAEEVEKITWAEA